MLVLWSERCGLAAHPQFPASRGARKLAPAARPHHVPVARRFDITQWVKYGTRFTADGDHRMFLEVETLPLQGVATKVSWSM